jgi:hypothetical protein
MPQLIWHLCTFGDFVCFFDAFVATTFFRDFSFRFNRVLADGVDRDFDFAYFQLVEEMREHFFDVFLFHEASVTNVLFWWFKSFIDWFERFFRSIAV